MARLMFVVPELWYFSQGGGPFTNPNGVVPRYSYNSERLSKVIRSGGTAMASGTVRFGITNADVLAVTDLYTCIRFRIRRLPSAGGLLIGFSGSATNALHVDFDTLGNLLFYNATGTGNPLPATTTAIPIGTTNSHWTTLQIFCHTNATTPNLGQATIIVNGVTVWTAVAALPGASAGLNQTGSLNTLNLYESAIPSAGLELDFDQCICDGATMPSPSRFTLLQPSAAGNYTNWATGTNFRLRDPNRSLALTQNSTTSLNSRQSYQLPTPRSMGITGNILSAMISGYSGSCPSTNPMFFFMRKGGVDTDLATFSVDSSERVHRSMIPAPALTPDDVIEVGYTSGPGAGTYRFAHVGMVIEHDTAYVAPTDQPVIIQRFNYTGTGTFQTVTLPFQTTMLFIMARTGGTGMAIWGQGQPGIDIPGSAGNMSSAWTDGLRLELSDSTGTFNTNAVVYDVLCIQDYENRMFGSNGFYQVSSTSPFNTEDSDMPTPMASPEGLWCTVIGTGTNPSNEYFCHVPAMGTNLSKEFDASTPVANVVNLLNAQGAQFKKAYFTSQSWTKMFSFKPSGFASVILFKIVQYTGDGTASKVVPVDLGGLTPCWANAFPHTNTSAYAKSNQQATAVPLNGGATSATAISAFGVDSVTIGSPINTNAVVYTLFVFAEGEDSAAANQYSGIYFIDPDARHDTLWDRTGAPATIDVKIPNPLYRTHFVGDE